VQLHIWAKPPPGRLGVILEKKILIKNQAEQALPNGRVRTQRTQRKMQPQPVADEVTPTAGRLRQTAFDQCK